MWSCLVVLDVHHGRLESPPPLHCAPLLDLNDNAQGTFQVHNTHICVGCWGDGGAECAGEGCESSVEIQIS